MAYWRRDFSVDGTEQHAETRNKLFDAEKRAPRTPFGTSFAWVQSRRVRRPSQRAFALLPCSMHNTTKDITCHLTTAY